MDKDEIGVYMFFVSVGLTPAGTICHLSRNVLISILGVYPGYIPRGLCACRSADEKHINSNYVLIHLHHHGRK